MRSIKMNIVKSRNQIQIYNKKIKVYKIQKIILNFNKKKKNKIKNKQIQINKIFKIIFQMKICKEVKAVLI